ncbi:preprotein translocase subunit YajC [Geosporobacter ferrireducens]|uniref:Preprotein translocase subunit YajC n=1 Tax=Geosporobacter ferrireducens TaxID=1424294 RepID=A0A1D8GPK1_9FIRM|nr:preprotein translocase subunit YajC [Geosporobacter ferrireducens]AOT72817.1 preprotein translocase subunit YajC [Geosporobacter ferrireducens]MTI55216.1 preprotein translocase subunit YajC [Geosporobacter ferrireducens]
MNAGAYSPIIMTAIFIGIFYFLIIRPQQKRDKQVKEMRSNIKVGDHIVTIGGIHGKIIKIKEDVLTIEVGADKTKLQISRWAVGNLNKNETIE